MAEIDSIQLRQGEAWDALLLMNRATAAPVVHRTRSATPSGWRNSPTLFPRPVTVCLSGKVY
ncbi:hypothetical protein XbrCFBP1976_17600 [Xanthomonas bromi]|uniref:Uncharacterized protein n=1 Tax=Xanthomonas bromi TaxID=56449 RepID=A0ABX5BPW5_9XANT|nr:hypothetical protein XbrCFBP1976_17600 [Xanthomonas bromi]